MEQTDADVIPPVEESTHELPSSERNASLDTSSNELEQGTDMIQQVDASTDERTRVEKKKSLVVLSSEDIEQLTDINRLVKVSRKKTPIGKNIFLVGASAKEAYLKWVESIFNDPKLQPLGGTVRIFIGTEYLDCYKLALEAHSELFREHHFKSSFTFSEKNVTMNAFRMVYQWMIDPSSSTWWCNFPEVLLASCYLKVKELTENCLIYIDEKFYEDKAVLLYLEMEKYNMNFFDTTIILRINKFFLTFVASEDFANLSIETVMQLLKVDTIGVNSEIEVFYTAVRWLEHRWKDRMQYTRAIMDTIRFGLISSWNILPIVHDQQPKIIRRILNVPGVHTLFSDALSFGIANAEFQRTPMDDIPDAIREILLNGPKHRYWIYDDTCPYHHSDDCPQIVKFTVTYELFENYLDMLSNKPVGHYATIQQRNRRIICCDQKDAIGVQSEDMLTDVNAKL